MKMREIINLIETNNTDDGQDRLAVVWDDINRRAAELKAAQDAGKKVPQGRKSKPQGFKSGRFDDFYDRVVAAGHEMFDATPDDLPPDDVKDWIIHHRNLFRKGSITAFRTIQVDADWIEHLQAGEAVGQHWNWELDENEFVQFNMDFDDTSRPIVTIEATVATSEVNFPLSVAYNVHFPNEREVFMLGLAQPEFVSLRMYDVDAGEVSGQNLRPDLVGQRLSV